MKQKVTFLIGLIFIVGIALGQEKSITISGKVTDSETGEVLPYATVGLIGLPIGTITNSQGEFDFHIPAMYSAETFQITMIGYEGFRAPVTKAETLNVFALKKSTTVLEEVVVSDSLTAGEIFTIALNRIPLNYPMEPYEMDGFYRDVKKVGDKYVSLLEAAITIYDKDYEAPRDYTKVRERVAIKEIRKSYDYDIAYAKYFEQYNLLEDLLLDNNVKYRSFNNEPQFYEMLKRKMVSGVDNKPLYLIYLHQPGYDLNVYIDPETYGIIRIEFGWGNGADPIFTYRKNRKLMNNVMRLDKLVEFEPHNGKLYLKYIRTNYKNQWVNTNLDTNEKDTELFQELLINNINDKTPNWISSSQKMKHYGLQYQHGAYNKVFWDNYNVIKETPLDQEIVKDLEEHMSLEKQFEEN
ncbi:MAG: carboxypeptidase-like regulatory domain-containing protein [Cyclobacteriaceae bacterium]|nr:carboxypeptidase-like regulatory domain-containing protein [Cyclobacteriaceae bacterium]